MGRIKTTLVKRTSKQLLEKTPELFTTKFGDNSKALGQTMPSKRIRNMIAGYITRLKRQTKKIIQDMPVTEA
jgi:small subunit ribosomal protein S17e